MTPFSNSVNSGLSLAPLAGKRRPSTSLIHGAHHADAPIKADPRGVDRHGQNLKVFHRMVPRETSSSRKARSLTTSPHAILESRHLNEVSQERGLSEKASPRREVA
jgi:hypothetical protein